MIVRRSPPGILLITQPAHAHLAARVMERCLELDGHPRRREILHAVAEHDNGWAEEDAAPALDPASGGIRDFINASLDVRHRVWPRAVARLADQPWCAALVAQHALTVYDRFRSDPDWASFFADLEAARDGMLREVEWPMEQLLADYVYVRLGDLISLTFCNGWTEEQHYGRFVVRPSGLRLEVSPDVFGGARVPMEIEGREIPDRRYTLQEDLFDALQRASTVVLRGEVSGGGKVPEP